MNKFIIIVITIYLLYYLGNILFDVFLKKESNLLKEETEEFSFSEFSKNIENRTTEVGIEDVEKLNTPKSFIKSDRQFSENNDDSEKEIDLETLRKKFEAEENIENFELPKNEHQIFNQEEQNKQSNNSVSDLKKHFQSLLNLAETSVQMIANQDGSRVYHSIL